MLQVFIIAEHRADKTAHIASAIAGTGFTVAVAASADRVPPLPVGVSAIPTPPAAGFGETLAACLADWDGQRGVLVIRGGTSCDDWPQLLGQCRRCQTTIASLGVWSPRAVPSAWSAREIRRLSPTISAVAAVHSGVVSLAAPVGVRLRDLPLADARSAAEVWEAAVAIAYADGRLVLEDRLISVGQNDDPEPGPAPAPPDSIARLSAGLRPSERRQLDKLRNFVDSRRSRPPQIIVDLQIDAGLDGANTPFELLERMHTGRSEHHVAPADDYGVNLTPGVQLTAFYLPQFHRLPVNDQAWGSGFTEWTNVTRCQPFFRGHLQPHLPADLGFYDLTNADVIARQTKLALHYGIGAFCFHYYWFGGRIVMPTPLRLFRELDDPQMKFCLCWANENWTRRWDGQDSEVILQQAHTTKVDRGLIRDILPHLQSGRYLRANGAAVIVIYRPALLGDSLEPTVEAWREAAAAEGVGPLLILGSNFVEDRPLPDPLIRGLDGLVEFPPHGHFGTMVGLAEAVFHRRDFSGVFHDYDDAVATFTQPPPSDRLVVPGVFPGWDNSARRRGQAHIYVNSSPPKFRNWLAAALRRSLATPGCDGMVFVNAWNEWAEAAHLEPCRWYGHAHLAACRDAIRDAIREPAGPPRASGERPTEAFR